MRKNIVYVRSCENCGQTFGTKTNSSLCNTCTTTGSTALFLMIGGLIFLLGFVFNIITC